MRPCGVAAIRALVSLPPRTCASGRCSCRRNYRSHVLICQVDRSSELCNSTSPANCRPKHGVSTSAAETACYFRTCPFWGIAHRKAVLHTHGTDGYGGNSDYPGDREGTPARRPCAPAARRCRPDADRPRGRPVLQGVHLADRARQDPPDLRDGRVARRATRRRRHLPGVRRLERRPHPRRGCPRPRRGARPEARVRRGPRGVRPRSLPGRRRPARSSSRSATCPGEGWARMHSGEVRTGIELLGRARALVERPEFSDTERAEVVFRLGVGRYLISSIATAVALFGESLALLDRSAFPSDLLRWNILTWRSRCYRRQRDYEAAREDVERALELAESLEDPHTLGEAYLQASLVAERDGHWAAGAHVRRARQGAVRGGLRSRATSRGCSTTSAGSSSSSASPRRPSRGSRRRSRSRSTTAPTTTWRRWSRRSHRCT